MLQVLAPDARLDVPPDTELFAREIDREFPAVRRVVDDLYAELARTNAAADAAFERDAVWPPGGFWERRETARVMATLPYLDGGTDFLAEFPREHAFRAVVTTPARFACDLADDVPAVRARAPPRRMDPRRQSPRRRRGRARRVPPRARPRARRRHPPRRSRVRARAQGRQGPRRAHRRRRGARRRHVRRLRSPRRVASSTSRATSSPRAATRTRRSPSARTASSSRSS